ncbi:chaplin family protein [Dactylosporangium sp. CS-033363]|uniref:chaplin family protein n=1 Tax=Dactylosporangium sp. CS-033363 TaxID=3239935 RepID=UPI003D92A468
MKTWVRKSLNVGVLSAGFLLVSGGAAHADWTTGYNAGLLNGNQFDTTLQVPVNVCGNSIAVLGFADANCGGGATAIKTESASATESATTEDWTSGYNAGVANGNQLDTTLQVPVNVSGNAISVLGFSSASSAGGATAVKGDIASDNGRGHDNGGWDNGGRRHRHHNGGGDGQGNSNGGDYNAAQNNSYPGANAAGDYTESAANRTEDWTSGYNAGLLNGNQFDSTLQVPVNLSGNAIALLGFAGASSQGGAWAVKGESAQTESATTEASHTTGYNAGLLNGNQLDTTLQLPINLCGNSIAILGFSSASCGGGAVAYKGDGGMDNGGRGHGHGHDNGGWDNGDDDGGWGGGHGHGHGNGNGDGNGNSNGGYGGQGNSNGGDGYGGQGNSNGGYGNNNAAPTGAYANAAGDASDTGANANSNASHMHKASKKTNKSIDLGEHAKTKNKKHHDGNGAGLAAASDNGYGGAQAAGDNGYGGAQAAGDNGDDNGGWDNGDDNGGWDNGGRRHHRHHDGRGNGNGGMGGGATAVRGGCGDWTTGFNAGLLNGNQFDTTLQVPVNISGNAVSLLGFSQAQSSGGALAYSC